MQLLWIAALYAVLCAGWSRMFASMDLESWMAWVPGLNLYLLVSKTWGSVYFWILAILSVQCLVMPYLYTINGHSLVLTTMCVRILAGMVWLMASLHMAASFGKGALIGVINTVCPFLGAWLMAGSSYKGLVPSLSNTNRKEALLG